MHHERLTKKGDVGPAHALRSPAGAWKAWRVDQFGYVRRRENGKWVSQHRVVMESALGRLLRKFENVHHKNGRRADNRPANLELWITPQPSGQRPEDISDWMVEFYPEVVRASLARYDARTIA